MHSYDLLQWKDIEENLQREWHMGPSLEEISHQVPRVLSQWSLTGHTGFPSIELWKHLWRVVYQASSSETPCPKFLLGAGHEGTLCLPHTKFQSPKEKHMFSIDYSLGLVSHSNHLRSGGNPSDFQVSRHQPRTNLASRPFLRRAGPVLLCSVLLTLHVDPHAPAS